MVQEVQEHRVAHAVSYDNTLGAVVELICVLDQFLEIFVVLAHLILQTR